MKRTNDMLARFERLAALARRETPPLPDVTLAVCQRLAAQAGGSLAGYLVPRWAYGFTGACAALALAMGWVGLQAWSALSDPVGGWLMASVVG